ncbi:MAG: isoprenylcysteine carboxylmethyltransferase family protein [Opitutaceae bacterium]|nr:isoprenylcysteine carboxylmethyltransferase family protein [Opitutaceae bacterium]
MTSLAKVPPPLAFALSLAAALVLTRQVPAAQWAWFRAPWVAAAVVLVGGAWIVWAWLEFRRYRTTILPLRQPTSLLCRGPFCVSRNPLYLAMVLLAATPWLAWGQVGLLLAPLAFFAFVNWVIVPFEEAKLRAIFGDAYAEYCRRVRRWC